jgi:hypothetical protein
MAKTRTLPVQNPGTGIGRRQVVRGLLTGAGAGLAIPGLGRAHPLAEHAHHQERIDTAQEKAKDPAGEPEFLEPYPFAMLETLGERIVPGAGAAGCALFVDSLLAVGTRDERQRFLSALGAIDGASRDRFGVPWPGLTEPQQVELLAAVSTAKPDREELAWTPGTSVAEHLARVEAGEEAPITLRDQFDDLKTWVMGAYYSSEAGLRELGYDGPVFADSFPGCSHPDGHRDGTGA